MQLMALVGLCFELCVSTSLAQNQAPPQTVVTPPPTAAPPAANPANVASPDAIIAVAYDLIENEIARHTEQWGNILQAFSTYESRHDAKDVMPFARGINSFQLFFRRNALVDSHDLLAGRGTGESFASGIPSPFPMKCSPERQRTRK